MLLQLGCAEVNGLSCLFLCYNVLLFVFVLKGLRSKPVHTEHVKHDFINNNPVEQRQPARDSRDSFQYCSFCKHALWALNFKGLFLHRWNVLIDNVHHIGCDKGGLCVLWHSFKSKSVQGYQISTLCCVEVGSMLFNHAYEMRLIFGPI